MNEIGEILKEARIEKGYTLDDLQQTTKIQKRYLQAIEDGNTEILPGRFYARAFVKQYADIVGLDGEKLLEEHLDETSQQASEEFADKVAVPPSRSTQVQRNSSVSSFQEYLPTVLIVLLVLAIFGVIYFAWRQANEANTDSLINEENTEQVAPPVVEEENEALEDPQDADGETEEPTPPADDEGNETADDAEEEEETTDEQTVSVVESTGAATTYEVAGPHPEEQTIVLEASGGSSWVSVNVAGEPEQGGLLNNGETLEVSFTGDATEAFIVVGYAPATIVRLNDVELEYAPEADGIITQELILQFEQ